MKNLIIAVFAVLVMGPAHAGLITVNDTSYNIEWKIDSYVNLESELRAQPWFGDTALARMLVGELGHIDDGDTLSFLGPFFATGPAVPIDGQTVDEYPFIAWGFFVPDPIFEGSSLITTTNAFALIATEASIPVPGSLVLITLGLAGLGVTRKERHRTQ